MYSSILHTLILNNYTLGLEPDCHYTWYSTSHNLLPKCQVPVHFCDELCVPEADTRTGTFAVCG